jgi:hypothetical protein
MITFIDIVATTHFYAYFDNCFRRWVCLSLLCDILSSPFYFRLVCQVFGKRRYKVYCIKRSMSTAVSALGSYTRFNGQSCLFCIHKLHHQATHLWQRLGKTCDVTSFCFISWISWQNNFVSFALHSLPSVFSLKGSNPCALFMKVRAEDSFNVRSVCSATKDEFIEDVLRKMQPFYGFSLV